MSLVASSSSFLAALRGENHKAPPVWFMRQAGRYMPEYRALREKHSFLEMVRSPQLIEEVTMLPIDRFGFDAAILFSDILPLLETIGCTVDFIEGKGPQVVRGPLKQDSVQALSFVQEGIRRLKKRLKVPLIGFAGGPFTVATYYFGGFEALMREMKELTLLELLTEQTIAYLDMQVKAGVDALQLFDTWAGLLSPPDFMRYVFPFHQKIVSFAKSQRVPIILFTRHTAGHLAALKSAQPDGIGCDSNLSLKEMRLALGKGIALQGNLDPHLLFRSPEEIQKGVRFLLSEMCGDPAFIVNLGHGMLPNLSPEAVDVALKEIRMFSCEKS